MLTISKKAASEAECIAICADSYAQETPFGRPVIIVDPKQFPPAQSFLASFLQPSVKSRAKRHIFEKMTGILNKDPELKDFDVSMMRIFNAASVGSMADTVATSQHMVRQNDTNGSSLECHIPSCTIIVCNKGENAGSNLFKNYLRVLTNELPGYDSQWHTMILWHEIGHACRGLNEAKADQLAALVCRYAFEDFHFLSAWADFRIIQPILGFEYEDAKVARQYPASGAFNIDEVILRAKDPTWQEIADTVADPRKLPEICTIEDSIKFAEKLKQKAPDAFKCRRFFELANAAQQLTKEGRVETMGEFTVAMRFALATLRLAAGKYGYPKSGIYQVPTPL